MIENWDAKVIPFHQHPLGFIDVFQELGAPLRELLHCMELTDSCLQTPQTLISYRQFLELIRCGLRLCPAPALGIQVSQRFKWYYHGLTGTAILTSSTFNQAGLAFHRYSCLAQPYYLPYRSKPFYYVDNQLRVMVPIEHLITSPDLDPQIYRFEVEFRLGLLVRMLKQFGDRRGNPAAAATLELNLSAPQGVRYEDLTGIRCLFDSRHSRLILPATVLDLEGDPLRKSVYKQALMHCDAAMGDVIRSAPNAEQVRALLLENIPAYPAIGQVAEKLDMTTRTLARKLRQENTSFTDLLNQVRGEVATYLLRSTGLSIDDIADSMGFGDTTNFRQAFRRWTGISAADVRRSFLPETNDRAMQSVY